jgi:hypothetical protein
MSFTIQNSCEVFSNLNTKFLKAQSVTTNGLSVTGNASMASITLEDLDSSKSTTSAVLTPSVSGGTLTLAADNVIFNMGCSLGHLDLTSVGDTPFKWVPAAAGDRLTLSVVLTEGLCTPEVGDRVLCSLAANGGSITLVSGYVSATSTLEFILQANNVTPIDVVGVSINIMLYGMEGTDCVVTLGS